MKPIWNDGKLSMELHKPDIRQLEATRNMGRLLAQLPDPREGKLLVDTCTICLQTFGGETEDPQGEAKETK